MDIWILGAEIASSHVSTYQDLDAYFTKNESVNVNVLNELVINYLGRRYAKKIDRAVQLSLYVSENLLKKFNLSENDRKNTGIMLGNNYAGWAYVEEQMYGLYDGDIRAINPYVATAWFPAAAQGELSIRNGLYGVSKTFAQDQLSSAVAIDYAIDMLMTHKIDYAIAGGHEALGSLLIQETLKQCELISETYLACDAACSLLLSRLVSDSSRAIAKISYLYMNNNLNFALMQAKQVKQNVDFVLLSPMNMTEKNQKLLYMEKKIIADLYGKDIPCEILTQSMGFIAGASFALEVTVALWILQKYSLQRMLIVGRDYDATQYCVLVIEAA